MQARAAERRHDAFLRIFKTLLRLSLILLAGTLVYHFAFDWDFSSALYFCIVTGTTVGYARITLATRHLAQDC